MIAELPVWLKDLIDAWPLVIFTGGVVVWVIRTLAEIVHLVRYHLGPNGTTTPVHKRLHRLEKANGIDDEDD